MELVATIILFGSIIGMGIILFRKIPALAELPENVSCQPREAFPKLFRRIKNLSFFKISFRETLLQRILSRFRVLILKVENKTSAWLQELREQSQKKRAERSDKYWQEIKKTANQEDKDIDMPG